MFVFVIYFLYLCTEIQTNYLSLKLTRKEDAMITSYKRKTFITEFNLEQLIELTPIKGLYDHYYANKKRYNGMFFFDYVDIIASMYDYVIQHDKLTKMFVCELFEDFQHLYGDVLTLDFFGAVYFCTYTTKLQEAQKNDIYEAIALCCSNDIIYTPYTQWLEELEEIKRNISQGKNAAEIEIALGDFQNNKFPQALYIPSDEDTMDVVEKLEARQITKEYLTHIGELPSELSHRSPRNEFPYFTDMATYEHLDMLEQACLKGARCVIEFLVEWEGTITKTKGIGPIVVGEALRNLNVDLKFSPESFRHTHNKLLRVDMKKYMMVL